MPDLRGTEEPLSRWKAVGLQPLHISLCSSLDTQQTHPATHTQMSEIYHQWGLPKNLAQGSI